MVLDDDVVPGSKLAHLRASVAVESVGTRRNTDDAITNLSDSCEFRSAFPNLLHKALNVISDLDVDVNSLVLDVESLHGASCAQATGCITGDSSDDRRHPFDLVNLSSVGTHSSTRRTLVKRTLLVVNGLREDLDWLLMDISAQQSHLLPGAAYDAHGCLSEGPDMAREVAAATAAAKRWHVRAENARRQALEAQELAAAKVCPMQLPRVVGLWPARQVVTRHVAFAGA